MSLDDHIWNLASKKLANEASEREVDELNALLAENPELHSQLKLMSKWWEGREEGPAGNGLALFSKIQAKIKDIEGAAQAEVIGGEQSVSKHVKTRQANCQREKLKQH
ncbi:hypothetical protein [Mucilaginibacter sp. R-33]|uniref:hypothetical protein n=1 Tax=Mucilaginibacter sp. R-33 TaxID=3416711 RepID=UPI003CEB0B7E